jgi:hypothetical protein
MGLILILLAILSCGAVRAAAPAAPAAPAQSTNDAAEAARVTLPHVLPPAQWRKMEDSVDRALAWLASQQAADGSFPTYPAGQPAVTSLCVLAFLSRGHQPGVGPYGERLNRAIDFVVSCQMADGLFSFEVPGPVYIQRTASHTAVYNHGISGLMLGEVYGQVGGRRAENVKLAVQKALLFTLQLQQRPKLPVDKGGWRYLRVYTTADSDISITAWQVMFLRSARNAEFDVSLQPIEDAMAYVRRCWDPATGMFFYALPGATYGASRGVTGAAIVTLSMGGQHETPIALAAGDYLVAHPFRTPGEVMGIYDKFVYSTFYCSQAAAQLGGRYWEKIYPPTVEVLLKCQSANGSWRAESNMETFGDACSTAFAVLSLTPAYQLLPIYQR